MATATFYAIVTDGEQLDQICSSESEARGEADDLRRMGHHVVCYRGTDEQINAANDDSADRGVSWDAAARRASLYRLFTKRAKD